MAEEFHQGGICGGNWWNSSRNLFGPCSLASSFNGWQSSPDHLFMDTMEGRSSVDDHDSAGSASDGSGGGGGSMLFQNVQNHPSGGGWINQDMR